MAPVNKTKPAKKRAPASAKRRAAATINGGKIPASQPQKVVSSGRKRAPTGKETGYVPKRKNVNVPARALPGRNAKTNPKSQHDDTDYGLPSSSPPSDAERDDDDAKPVIGNGGTHNGSLNEANLSELQLALSLANAQLTTPEGPSKPNPSSPPSALHFPLHSSPSSIYTIKTINTISSDPPFHPIPASLYASIPFHPDAAYLSTLHPNIHALSDSMQAATEIQMALPDITTDKIHPVTGEITEIIHPWKPSQLIHLYILSYARDDYNTCDLITDTWIREFQAIDKIASTKIWRRNIYPYDDEQLAHEPGEENGPVEVSPEVTKFDPKLLGELFEHTAPTCGARLFWADAMALCGDVAEDVIAGDNKELLGGKEEDPKWPEGFLWEVMRVSLRLCRAHRSLKCEEKYGYAWCDRYHEHARRGEKCYRRVAWEEGLVLDGGLSGGWDGESEVGVEVGGVVEKRVTFAGEDEVFGDGFVGEVMGGRVVGGVENGDDDMDDWETELQNGLDGSGEESEED